MNPAEDTEKRTPKGIGLNVFGKGQTPFGVVNPNCGRTLGWQEYSVERCSNASEKPRSRNDGSITAGLGCRFYHCPSGCPLGVVSVGREAMDSSTTPRVAALRAEVEKEKIWEGGEFCSPPTWSNDRWILNRVREKWLIRAHGKNRVRKFHPLHRSVPFRPEDLTGERITVGFLPDGRKMIDRDEWTNPPTNLVEPKRAWKGWTLLRLKSSSNYSTFGTTTTEEVPARGIGAMTGSASSAPGGSIEGVVEVPYAVWSSANEQLWTRKGKELGGFLSEESRVDRSFDDGSVPPKCGYAQDTVKNKGIYVAQQLPLLPENSQKEFGDDETESSEWERVSETG